MSASPTTQHRPSAARAWEVAPDVYCLGPRGRTQTNIYFVRSGSRWVLVDAGWARDAPSIKQAARSLFGAGSRPSSILLTHFHPDHAGAALQLARQWSCAVCLHPAEMPLATWDFAALKASPGPLDRYVVLPIMQAMGQRRRETARERASLAPVACPVAQDGILEDLPEWRWIHTPGHTPGHISLFRASDRVLVTGDAVVTTRIHGVHDLLHPRPGLSGPPWYTTWNRQATAASIATLARLEPQVLASGHGWPVTGDTTAGALRTFAAGFGRGCPGWR